MFERLVRARADVERNERKLKEAQKKYDAAVERLKETEKTEILELVTSQKMTPEELAEFLGMGVKVPTVADVKGDSSRAAKTAGISAWGSPGADAENGSDDDTEDDKTNTDETEDSTDEDY